MSDDLLLCIPASDGTFRGRVRRLVRTHEWDLRSPEGIALMQAILRETYPSATVLPPAAPGRARHALVTVRRDGLHPALPTIDVPWVAAVFDAHGPAAYRTALRIVSHAPLAETIVERGFREFANGVTGRPSVADGGTAVEAIIRRLALDERSRTIDAISQGRTDASALMTSAALSRLRPIHRAVLELAVFEGLKTGAIAERMQFAVASTNRLLGEALRSLRSGDAPNPGAALADWREALRAWNALPEGHSQRRESGFEVAHAWLGYQAVTGGVRPGQVVLLSDMDRRYVTATSNAAPLLGRESMIGLRIDDITAPLVRPALPELWASFLTAGSMQGEYDCDRPGLQPIKMTFRAFARRPLPDLQVSYLQPILPVPASSDPLLAAV